MFLLHTFVYTVTDTIQLCTAGVQLLHLVNHHHQYPCFVWRELPRACLVLCSIFVDKLEDVFYLIQSVWLVLWRLFTLLFSFFSAFLKNWGFHVSCPHFHFIHIGLHIFLNVEPPWGLLFSCYFKLVWGLISNYHNIWISKKYIDRSKHQSKIFQICVIVLLVYMEKLLHRRL